MNLDELLAEQVWDTRQRTLKLIVGLTDAQFSAPVPPDGSPLRWVLGHIGWLQERYVLRQVYGVTPLNSAVDELYDPAIVPLARRESVGYSRDNLLNYLREVRDATMDRLQTSPSVAVLRRQVIRCLAREDLLGEAILAARHLQVAGAPELGDVLERPLPAEGGPFPGDVRLPACETTLGTLRDNGLDDLPRRLARVPAFSMARAPVTQAEYADFVEAGGYAEPRWWSEAGWAWKVSVGRLHPVGWRRDGRVWRRAWFDRLLPLEPHRPVAPVAYFEAEAYCRWAGRRLPNGEEWDAAAGNQTRGEATYPWGTQAPTPHLANSDALAIGLGGTQDVGCLSDGDSAAGFRQLLGNVWEWTVGRAPDGELGGELGGGLGGLVEMVRDPAGLPSFVGPENQLAVVRGGSWATRSCLLGASLRLVLPAACDSLWTGFRTCPHAPPQDRV